MWLQVSATMAIALATGAHAGVSGQATQTIDGADYALILDAAHSDWGGSTDFPTGLLMLSCDQARAAHDITRVSIGFSNPGQWPVPEGRIVQVRGTIAGAFGRSETWGKTIDLWAGEGRFETVPGRVT